MGAIHQQLFFCLLKREKDFLGGPAVKTLLSNAEVPCSIPGQGARIPPASRPKHQNIKNRNNTVTNSIKTFLNGPHYKKKKKKNLKKKKVLASICFLVFWNPSPSRGTGLLRPNTVCLALCSAFHPHHLLLSSQHPQKTGLPWSPLYRWANRTCYPRPPAFSSKTPMNDMFRATSNNKGE